MSSGIYTVNYSALPASFALSHSAPCPVSIIVIYTFSHDAPKLQPSVTKARRKTNYANKIDHKFPVHSHGWNLRLPGQR